MTITFALSYDFPQDFTGKAELNVPDGVQSDICCFRAMTLVDLIPGCKQSSF